MQGGLSERRQMHKRHQHHRQGTDYRSLRLHLRRGLRGRRLRGRSGDQGSQGEPPRSLGGLYAAVGAPAQSYRGSTIIPWPLPPPLALSTIFRRFSADVAVLPAASPFRGAATPAFPLILRRAASNCVLGFFARFSVARLRGRQGAPGCPRLCARAETCGVEASAVSVREGGVLSSGLQPGLGGSC